MIWEPCIRCSHLWNSWYHCFCNRKIKLRSRSFRVVYSSISAGGLSVIRPRDDPFRSNRLWIVWSEQNKFPIMTKRTWVVSMKDTCNQPQTCSVHKQMTRIMLWYAIVCFKCWCEISVSVFIHLVKPLAVSFYLWNSIFSIVNISSCHPFKKDKEKKLGKMLRMGWTIYNFLTFFCCTPDFRQCRPKNVVTKVSSNARTWL